MSGYSSKAEVVEVIKSTITTDWNKTGLSTDPADYNIAGIIRDAFYYRGAGHGWSAVSDADAFVDSLRRNLRRKARQTSTPQAETTEDAPAAPVEQEDAPDELAPGMYRVRVTVTNRDGVHTVTEDMNPAAVELARSRPGWSVEILGESRVTIVEDEQDAAAEQAPAGKVRLIGIGNVPAAPLSDVKAGDRITWNYGQTYTVVSNTQVAANTYELVERGEDGREWTRRKRGTKLVARRPGIDQTPAASEASPCEAEQLAAERRRVVRHFQPHTSEQRATLAASHRAGHRQRQAVGEHFYTHPDVPGVAFDRRDAAARAGVKATRTTRPAVDPRTVPGTPENVDARAAARARGELAAQAPLTFDENDRQAMTGAQLRAVPAGALALF